VVTACEPSAHPPRQCPASRGSPVPQSPRQEENVLVLSERQGHPAILMPADTRLQLDFNSAFLGRLDYSVATQ
jgi:hypothetical protein